MAKVKGLKKDVLDEVEKGLEASKSALGGMKPPVEDPEIAAAAKLKLAAEENYDQVLQEKTDELLRTIGGQKQEEKPVDMLDTLKAFGEMSALAERLKKAVANEETLEQLRHEIASLQSREKDLIFKVRDALGLKELVQLFSGKVNGFEPEIDAIKKQLLDLAETAGTVSAHSEDLQVLSDRVVKAEGHASEALKRADINTRLVDEAIAERDNLRKEKAELEARIQELKHKGIVDSSKALANGTKDKELEELRAELKRTAERLSQTEKELALNISRAADLEAKARQNGDLVANEKTLSVDLAVQNAGLLADKKTLISDLEKEHKKLAAALKAYGQVAKSHEKLEKALTEHTGKDTTESPMSVDELKNALAKIK